MENVERQSRETYSSSVGEQTSEKPNEVLAAWLNEFDRALNSGDVAAAKMLFADACYWRDLVTFTWNIVTMEGRDAIGDMLRSVLSQVSPKNWTLSEPATLADGVVSGWIEFETATAKSVAHVRLVDGKCFTLLTAISDIRGHEQAIGRHRSRGAPTDLKSEPNWFERRDVLAETLGVEADPYVVIIGGGQGGLAMGARLKQLGVPTLIVDKHARSGDQWRSRYSSLCLHDPVWYDHMPYMKFPESWPIYTPKDKIAEWLEFYEKAMELTVWHSSTCEAAEYDESEGIWTVNINRNGETRRVRCKQLVMATGASGFPNVPTFKGQEMFKGKVWHSSQHPGGNGWEGKNVVVIGGNNSAHDICADLVIHGASATMVQRSSTLVARGSTLMEFALKPLYSEEALEAGISTSRADLIFASIPYALLAEWQKPLYETIQEHDRDFYDRLRAAGFMLDFGEDGSGLMMKYVRRGGGYYIEVGASEMVADGRIKLKSGVDVDHFTETSVVLSDGTELPADLVVLATGYSSMTDWTAQIISQEVADRVGPCWGIGSDTTNDPGPWQGELRNMWKPTAQPGLWFHGGNLHFSRHYSLYLAMQLKARFEGLPITVYGAPRASKDLTARGGT